MHFLLRVILSARIVAGVSELGRRYTLFAAVLASLPLTQSIFWVVLPSLVFFLVLPLVRKAGTGFFPALLTSSAVMVVTYRLYTLLLAQLGSRL